MTPTPTTEAAPMEGLAGYLRARAREDYPHYAEKLSRWAAAVDRASPAIASPGVPAGFKLMCVPVEWTAYPKEWDAASQAPAIPVGQEQALLTILQGLYDATVDERERDHLAKGIGISTPRGRSILAARAALSSLVSTSKEG